MAGVGDNMMAAGTGNTTAMSHAVWYASRGVVELRATPLPPLAPGEARVRTLFSGISRGTERLVLEGNVGRSEWERMRCPMQEGMLPFPVKYGYCAVGVVEDGPAGLLGSTVFCLHPHQDLFQAPADRLALIPARIPARRATLAANMETALNAVWDSGAGPGDRIVVVGAGVVGLLVASLAARLPGAAVTVVDVEEARRPVAEALGARFAGPVEAPGEADVVFHASASAAGLNTALGCAGLEGTVVEMSWYGDTPVKVGLGGAFHSRRLRLISSQVGQVSPGRRPRWDYRRRIAAALNLLDQPALDRLVAEEIAFADAPRELPRILAGGAHGLAPVIRYPQLSSQSEKPSETPCTPSRSATGS
jgi:threonine dehydrogenase-like Zn-dependent dehydrogenase